MTSEHTDLRAEILEIPSGAGDSELQAAEWGAYLHSGQASDEGRRQFSAWLRASEANAQAYQRVEQWWRDFDLAAVAADEASVVSISSSQPKGSIRSATLSSTVWRTGLALAASLILAVGAWFYLAPESAVIQQYYTSMGEIKTLALPDGTSVIMGGESALSVDFSADQRRVELSNGRAYFDVAAQAEAPFTVAAGATQIRVLGTAFDVSMGATRVQVLVNQGRVEVADRDGGTPPAQLEAGQQISALLDGGLSKVTAFDPVAALSWREGRLEYVDVALIDVLAEVNRYRKEKIYLVDKSLGHIQITMGIPIEQTDVLLTGLRGTLPVDIERSPMGVMIKEGKKLKNN